MSDTNSDSEFASADEGDIEDEKFTTNLKSVSDAPEISTVSDSKTCEQDSCKTVPNEDLTNEHDNCENIVDLEEEEIQTNKENRLNNSNNIITDNVLRVESTDFKNCEEETQINQGDADSFSSPLDRLATSSGGGGWNSWSSWGSSWGTSVLSAAKTSVSTLGRELADGITTVSTSVEAILDVPPAESVAKENIETASLNKDNNDAHGDTNEAQQMTEADGGGGWGSWAASSWGSWGGTTTDVVQRTGMAVVTSGLGALESLGKHTMNVLQEHDPGLKNTKALLRGEKASLSECLREAREKTEQQSQLDTCASGSDDWEREKELHFGALFEMEAGAVHLEALELLSSQCETQLAGRMVALKGKASRTKRRLLTQMKEAIESVSQMEEDDTDEEVSIEEVQRRLEESASQLSTVWPPASGLVSKLVAAHEAAVAGEETGCESEPDAVQRVALRLLAALTARVVEQLHRLGQLTLTGDEKVDNWLELSRGVSSLCRACRCEASRIAHSHVNRLRGCEGAAAAVTGILLETANSRSYMEDATVRLCPVLQLGYLLDSSK